MSQVESSDTSEQVATQKSKRRLSKQNSLMGRKRDDSSSQEEEEEESRLPIAGRVIGENEIGRFIDLGLGRGVDATKPSPWLSKSSFQVRKVNFDNIIGTEEGGLIKHFEEVIESVQQLQTNMSASVPASQQVSVGIDSELSRSYNKTKRSVGTKILTRTVSFRADFDDICVRRRRQGNGKGRPVPQRAITLPEGEVARAEVKDSLVHAASEDHEPTFEERLSNWILDHLKPGLRKRLDDLIKTNLVAEDANPIDKMNILGLNRKDLRPYCHDFVSTTCITHYVCAIELGAAVYKVMSEEEVQTQLKTKGSIGVSSAADVSVSQQAKWYNRKKQKNETIIGVIGKDGKVERGTTGEAVVGVKFQPLSSVVVRCNVLKKALEAALQRYIDSQGIAKYGPFYISCHSEQLFFKVDENTVRVTDDITKASEFFVVPCEEDRRRQHFSIFFNSKSKLKSVPVGKKTHMRVKPIPRYLCASVNFRGISNGSLELKLNAKESKSMLVLHDRRSKHYQPVDLTDWINGKEIFYINCKHRSFKKDSYICVTAVTAQADTKMEAGKAVDGEVEVVRNGVKDGAATSGGGETQHRFTTCCKPNISSHDDRSTFMLFRLIRVKQKDNWDEYEEHETSDTEAQGEKGESVSDHKGGRGGGGGGGGKGKKNKDKRHSITEVLPED